MRTYLFLLLSAALVPSCQNTQCGDGTIERNGSCEPANEMVSNATCGPFTTLEGDKCVPMFDPTICDPSTTAPSLDPATGVVTCVGTGGGGCDGTFVCPTPADQSHQSICGQIYDLKTGDKFQGTSPTGAKCTATTAEGPCSLRVDAFDALDFATDPMAATKLVTGPVYLDDCGRYRVPDITVPTGAYIGLGFDDFDAAKMYQAGNTNAIGTATSKNPGTATILDGWIATKATTDMWTSTGGPPLSGGIFTAIFFAGKTGRALQSGVTVTKSNNPITANDYYFMAGDATRGTIDGAASSTGANGTGLVTSANPSQGLVYSGSGGLEAACKWPAVAAASLANIVFVQEFRPTDVFGMTCGR